jgi:hypothetical protein
MSPRSHTRRQVKFCLNLASPTTVSLDKGCYVTEATRSWIPIVKAKVGCSFVPYDFGTVRMKTEAEGELSGMCTVSGSFCPDAITAPFFIGPSKSWWHLTSWGQESAMLLNACTWKTHLENDSWQFTCGGLERQIYWPKTLEEGMGYAKHGTSTYWGPVNHRNDIAEDLMTQNCWPLFMK